MRRTPIALTALLAAACLPADAWAGRCGSTGISFSAGARSVGACGFRGHPHGFHGRHNRSHYVGVRTYRNCGPSYFSLSIPIHTHRSYRHTRSRYTGGYGAYSPRYVVVDPALEQPAYQADRGAGDEYHRWQMEQRIVALERELANERAEAMAQAESPLAAPELEPDVIRLASVAPAVHNGPADGPVEDGRGSVEAEPVTEAGDDAWLALDRSDFAAARDAFAARLDGAPGDTAARVGLAMSWAWLGEALTADFEMKRALRTDPHGVAAQAASMEARRADLRRLARALRAGTTRETQRAGRWTLIASVELLADEREEARRSIKRARRLGETDQAAKNLWRLLGLSDEPPVVVAERD
jgi:hypothetical protein